MQTEEYEVVVLGAGFAGGLVGTCLGSKGIKTLVVEKKIHPRFVIGESTTPLTTMDMKKLSEECNVPELVNISNYLGMSQLGLVTYPKELFWFGFNYAGQPLQLHDETIAVTTFPPLGPESHMLRSDLDEYLTSLFPKYNVDYIDNAAIEDFQTSEKQVDIKVHMYAKEDRKEGSKHVRCKFVVDCSGHNCFLARRYGLHHHDAHLQHRSRTTYAHFRRPPGWDLDAICGGRNPYIHTTRNNGTIHHFFEGGWFWVIPFENDTISIGLVLDLDLYPLDSTVSAQEEWDTIVNRYPTVKAHLSGLVPIKPLIRFGRIQITSESILGDRFVLSPHAASFIDPLYSTGMSLTTRFVRRLLRKMKDVLAAESPSKITEILTPLEEDFKLEVDQIDKLVGGTFAATHHNVIFRQYWRLWIISSMKTLFQTKDTAGPLFSSYDPGFVKDVDVCYEMVMNFAKKVRNENKRHNKSLEYKEMHVNEAEAVELATTLKKIIDKRLDMLHSKLLFDVMPTFGVQAIEPVISPGGAASEYQMDFLVGQNRPRIFSFVLAMRDMITLQLKWVAGKILGRHYRYGNNVVRLFSVHHAGDKVRRATPAAMIKRIYNRWRNVKLQ